MASNRLWTKKEMALLGTAEDASVAKKIKRSKTATMRKRQDLKVSPFRLAKFVPTANQKRLLGKRPDGSLAELWGVTRLTVLKSRQALGIPAYGGK